VGNIIRSSYSKLCLAILIFGTIWGLAATILLINETQNMAGSGDIQQSNDPRDVDTLSIVHACPTDIEPSLGPSWSNITIGVSNDGAIQDLYGV